MERTRTHGLVLAIGIAIATIAVVVTLVLVVISGSGFAGSTSTAQLGWLAPLLAASIIGGLAWVLLSEDHPVDDERPHVPSADCPECGRTVMGEWRMCPYCGEVLDPRYALKR